MRRQSSTSRPSALTPDAPEVVRVIVELPPPVGTVAIEADERGLTRISLRPQDQREIPPVDTRHRSLITRAVASLRAYCRTGVAGELPSLSPKGTAFQRAVWKRLSRIPSGQSIGYGDLATTCGHPGAARAVGAAMAANPFPILVPCHRVLASDGKLGGFTGGLDLKRALLDFEGIAYRG